MQFNRIHNWIVQHDDSLLFTILYIGLAVVLSIWISLFWLVAVVVVHFAFEVVRQKESYTSWATVLAESFWELKLDIALVLFALAVSLYMEIALGVAGLQGAARMGSAAQAGLRTGARFAAWQRIIRGLLLSVDDAAQIARAVFFKKKNAEKNGDEDSAAPSLSAWGSWVGKWAKGDWFAVALAGVCLLLLLIAPFLTDHTYHSVATTLLAELRPLPTE